MSNPYPGESPRERESPREIQEMIEQLAEVVAQPEFQNFVDEVAKAPEDAEELLTVSQLRQRGLAIPEGFRITLRAFEDPDEPKTWVTSIFDERESGVTRTTSIVDEREFRDSATVCATVGVSAVVTACFSSGYTRNPVQ
jgi:hypothetical protein